MPLPSRRAALACLCALPFTAATRARAAPSPDDALARLMAGNRRFVADDPARPDTSRARRAAAAGGQAPFAAILGCADSRAAPEQLFAAGIGEVFAVRVAGNALDSAGLGSLEFSVAQLGTPLVMVLGHDGCGAVAAAIAVSEQGARLSEPLMAVVQPILPAVAAARREAPADLLDAATDWNARLMARRIREKPGPLAAAIAAGTLRVEAARHVLATGELRLLPA